jgi:hypothetical protein
VTLLVSANEFGPVSISMLRVASSTLCDLCSAELYDLAVCLGVSEEQARPVWLQLLDRGFIQREECGRYAPTDDMRKLAQARLGKPLARAKAQGYVEQLITNARRLNAMGPDVPYFYVRRLAVFGSYLDESREQLGDLDVAWEPFERPGVRSYMAWCFSSGVDGHASTRGVLRPRSPVVRLIDMSTLLSLECPFRVVYEFDEPKFLDYAQKLLQDKKQRALEYRQLFEGLDTDFSSRSRG